MSITLTGTFTRLDGSPATGTVKATPSRSPIMDPDGKIVISGPQTFPLDSDGTLSVPIPASNDPDLGPPFTYAVDVNLTHANWKISKVWMPHGSTTVDLSEIGDYTPVPGVATRVVTIPADGTDGQVLVWDGAGFSWDYPPEGPQGPPGEVTTAALTAALAGKVTGTGMTLRHDATVGTRVLLDHPGGTTMLWGDTGWRALFKASASSVTVGTLPDGYEIGNTAGNAEIAIRRTHDRIYVRIHGLKATSPDKTLLTLPTGFTVQQAIGTVPVNTSSPTTMRNARVTATGTNVIPSLVTGDIFGQANNHYPVVVELLPSGLWPATLPGLPA